ncbi:hypothetical protein PC116_g34495, partial [Phytophthora cactorum]
MPGKDGLEDEEKLEYDPLEAHTATIIIQRARFLNGQNNAANIADLLDSDDDNDDDDEDMDGGNQTPSSGEEDNDDDEDEDEDVMMVDTRPEAGGADVNVPDWIAPGVAALEEEEATMAR